MTLDAARRFLLRVRRDIEFRRDLGAAANSAERERIARGAGFEFTRPEFEAVCAEWYEMRELSGEAAEEVAATALEMLGAVHGSPVPPYGPPDFYSASALDPAVFPVEPEGNDF